MFRTYKYKLKREFVRVDPAYTSQTCSECGNVSKESRRTQSKFVCVSCGFELNADINAAKNILSSGRAYIRKREAVVCA